MWAPLPIIQYWHTTEPPAYIADAMRSFDQVNPGRPHLVFDATSAREFIGRSLSQREVAAFDACGPPAMQADYLRYCAAWELGGVWADAGFSCARELTPLLNESAGGELFASSTWKALLMNGLMAFAEPRHPFPGLAVEIATGLIEERWPGKVNAITGPLVITTIYRIWIRGSFDAFIDETSGIKEGGSIVDLPRYTRRVCDLIADYDRVVAACEGIRVHPAEARFRWVETPEPLPHRSQDHWAQKGWDVYADRAHRRQ